MDTTNVSRQPSLWRQASAAAGHIVAPASDEIAARAYAKSLARGAAAQALDNWLEAERELLRERLRATDDHLRHAIES